MNGLSHLRLQEFRLPPGEEWKNAGDAWRFLRVDAGAAYWMGEPRAHALAAGEMLVVPPSANAVILASQLNEVVLHGFAFDPDYLCGTLSLEERNFFEQRKTAGSPVPLLLPSAHPASRRFAELLAESDPPGALARFARILQIVSGVFDEDLRLSLNHHVPSNSASTRFEQLVAAMPDVELIHHSPAQLARLCGCSSRHFNRMFWKQFGSSIRTRQTELRLLRARQLLSSTNGKIVQVAFDSGYRNVSLFNALFKRRFGVTPSQWRRTSQP